MQNRSGINPTEYKVLVLPDKVEEKTAGGIYKPQTTRDRDQHAATTGTLVAISPMAFKFDDWPPQYKDLLPKVGDRVVYQKYIGSEIEGKDKETYNKLVHWRATHPEFTCHLEGYSDIVHLLMQASDAIVTRGGTTTCAKALHFQCPIIFNAFGGIMPQEELTWKFFRNGADSQKIENAGDFARIIDGWLADPAGYSRAREKFLALRYVEDPTVLIEELVGLAGEVGGGTVPARPFPRGPVGSPRLW